MKGIIFVELSEIVQEKFGHKTWNQVLQNAEPESKGVYTAAENYSDEEADKLLNTMSAFLSKSKDEVLKLFGVHLIKAFSTRFPQFFKERQLFPFIESVEPVIHAEIKKIYSDASFPKLVTYYDGEHLMLEYHSVKKMCALTHGLIKGASYHFNEPVEIEQCRCTHNGDDFCLFKISKKG